MSAPALDRGGSGFGIAALLLPFLAACLIDMGPWSRLLLLGFAALLAALRLIDPARRAAAAAIALGFATPIAPALGTPTLLGLGLIFLCLAPMRPRIGGLLWATPYLLVMACWVAAESWYRRDAELLTIALRELFAFRDAHRAVFWEWVRSDGHQLLSSWEALGRWLLVFAVLDAGRRDPSVPRAFLGGAVAGLPFALGAAALQVLGSAISLPNQVAYWTKIGRFTGTFTDPNAFGIFVLLVLPYLFLRWRAGGAGRVAMAALGAASIALASYSGSRTFFVGLLLYGLAAASRLGRRPLLVFVLAVALLVLAMNATGIFDRLRETGALPVGVQRLVRSVRSDTVAQSVAHRAQFLWIDWLVFRDFPLLGCGFNHYRALVPSYGPLVGLTRGWTDNPNSLYLGVLAELGLVGLAAFVLAAGRLRFRPDAPPPLRTALVVLAVVLAMGPHLDFDEIALLVAAIAGLCLDVAPGLERLQPFRVVAIAIVAVAVFAAEGRSDRGISALEPDPIRDPAHPFQPGPPVAWTSGVGQVRLFRPEGDILNISMRDTWPVHAPELPLLVKVFVDGKHIDTVRVPWMRFERYSWYLPSAAPSPAYRTIRLEASATFRPSSLLGTPDWRRLGLMVRPIGFERAVPGGAWGVFPWESASDHRFRWSCGRNVILALRLPASEARLELLTLAPRVSRVPLGIRIRVKGGVTRVISLKDHRWRKVKIPLPRGAPALITLEADRTFMPVRSGVGGDDRELGFALGPVTLSP